MFLSPKLIRALGALSSLATLLYFGAVFWAFRLGMEDPIAEKIMRQGILYVYAPLFLWVIYFYARINLGRRLLEHGQAAQAYAYTRTRVKPDFWLLSAREATIHASTCLQACLRLGRLDEAKALIQELPLAKLAKGKDGARLGWMIQEVYLRAEDLIEAKRCFERFERTSGKHLERASLLAARAEVEIRSHRFDEAARFLNEASWSGPDAARVAWSKGLLMAAQEEPLTDPEQLLALIERAKPEMIKLIPATQAELTLLQARALAALGREEARQALLLPLQQDPESLHPDARARHLIASSHD